MKIAKRRLVFKISTARLKKARWNLTLTLDEAKASGELIALGDSQTIRWIDELNGAGDVSWQISEIKRKIRAITKEENSIANRHAIGELHKELDRLQFIPDYVHVVSESNSDYLRAVKGFKINGEKFARLVGTNGGLKNSTVVFVNEKHIAELRRRIDNGRNKEKKAVPGKFEAYCALPCSGSVPVSMPNGVIVVKDCVTKFKENVVMLNDEGRIEPLMTEEDDFDTELKESDGYGLAKPELMERWSKEVGLDYIMSGCCVRQSFTKGMVFTFDLDEFAEVVAGKYEIVDAWGNIKDIRDAELILTTSMLKLWDSYDSIEQYFQNCEENHYTFALTKTAPEVLESRRSLNYQFIQSYNLTDEQVDELIKPTMDEITDVLLGDYRKAILFMNGVGINEKNVVSCLQTASGAMIAEPETFHDPYIKRLLHSMIRKRIEDAKIGVLSVHGNYSILCGDPFALCQHMFGLPVTGLLKAGEIFNRYWVDCGADCVVAFRAPMSCHNNIRKMKVARREDVLHWYRYMRTVTLLNAWDSTTAALNGADKDGDLVFLTDNHVLLDNLRPTKTIVCVQRDAPKVIPTEETQIASNVASFGDDIGKTTNKVTAMYDVQSVYDEDSEEYKELEYRIMSGQL